MTDARMRVGDDDRDGVAEQLREHFAAGRITDSELQERLDTTFRARTMGDLDPVLADLPRLTNPAELARPTPTSPAPTPDRQPAVPGRSKQATALRAAWAAWLVAVSVNLVIWLLVSLSAEDGPAYFWPMWVAGPWGAVLLASTIAYKVAPREDDDR